jgi:hypothetical protein
MTQLFVITAKLVPSSSGARVRPALLWANVTLTLACIWLLRQTVGTASCVQPANATIPAAIGFGMLGLLFVDAWTGRIASRS